MDAVLLAVLDLIFAGLHGPYIGHTPRSDDLQVRSQSLDAQLETDLVVALAGGSVADGRSALLSGDLHQPLGDGGTGHGGAQQILVLIHGAGLDAGHDVVVTEIVHQILDVQLGGA